MYDYDDIEPWAIQYRRYMGTNPRFTPIETVVNVNDPNLWWFKIPGFNGYEISNTGLVRSMKHFKKYPYGLLIKPRERKTNPNPDPSYELSDNNNVRQVVRLSQLQHLARTNPYNQTPCHTDITNIGSRNMRCFIKKELKVQPLDNTRRFPKFTVIEEPDPFKERMPSDVIVPIESLDGSVYYGRNDIHTIYN